ncbi:Na+/H+ antiporter subunit E [Spongiactinospora sp. TRM90649]|uniref:Na+/H+ antiporter subunit E n=1 Tax=Spongiactinospora sp. TRM90649 TaxID=3031114 RepID=UPI0023F9ACB6|nr:Na+/H+ antiporter subunit E [Spongiactinospora sp. TRM90649]MDF5756027.1 Na+/H+ antiporter subunit E [Spongiactinospora sp. TRM90649]
MAGPVVGMAVVWVLLWGSPTPANVLSGLAVGVLVTGLSRLPVVGAGARPRLGGCLRLLGWFTMDVARSGARVAWQAVRPGPPPVNAMIAVPLRTTSDLTMVVTAMALSALPGSLVIEVRRSNQTLYVHVLGIEEQGGLDKARADALALEKRVIRAIGTAHDRSEVL